MTVILSVGCSMIFHSMTPLNFSHSYYASLFIPINIGLEDDCLGNSYINSLTARILVAKYEQANIHNFAFDKHNLSLDQQDLFNDLSIHKKLMDPFESIITKRFTLNLNLELSQCIIALIKFLILTTKL